MRRDMVVEAVEVDLLDHVLVVLELHFLAGTAFGGEDQVQPERTSPRGDVHDDVLATHPVSITEVRMFVSKKEPTTIVEMVDHPWYVAVQFHPEFQSKPTDPHPLFRDFIGAALQRREAARTSADGPAAKVTSL